MKGKYCVQDAEYIPRRTIKVDIMGLLALETLQNDSMNNPFNFAWEAKVHWPLKRGQQKRQTKYL